MKIPAMYVNLSLYNQIYFSDVVNVHYRLSGGFQLASIVWHKHTGPLGLNGRHWEKLRTLNDATARSVLTKPGRSPV